MNIKKYLLGIVAGILLFGSLSTVSHAATGYTLFDGASYVIPGNASLRAVDLSSNSTIADSGIDFTIPAGTTFGSLTNLQTDYKVTASDCGGGSPRFQINVDGKNIFVYLGPTPNFTGCTLNTWLTTENFIGSTDKVFDLTQLGGQFYSTYNDAKTLLGTHTVTGIQLVVDGGWKFPGGQTILVDNTNINGNVYDYELPKYTVTIVKYLNGVQATTTLTGGVSYPMLASWNAANIGVGSGSYALGPTGFNNPNPYFATTSDLTSGASYSTHEVTGGTSNVLPISSDCQQNKTRLVGYTTGDSLSSAAAETPVSTVPNLTDITSDQYIIVWNQTCPTASGEITSPATDGDHVTSTLNLAATYFDGDVPNTDDGVQWAVRQGTCAAGTNTVLGNVDGHHDVASWDGNSFSFSADIRDSSKFPPGDYCFVFNPTDDPGQPNVRLTRNFVIDAYVPQTMNDCKKEGWKNYVSPTFKNQGDCVSWIQSSPNATGNKKDN